MRQLLILAFIFSTHIASAANCERLLTVSAAEQARVLFFKRSLRRAGSVEKLAQLRYGDTVGSRALTLLNALGPDFGDLIADPGLVLRIDEFVAFAKEHVYANPWEARSAFSQSLGTAHVFRALALTPDMAATTNKLGLVATYIREEGKELRASGADPYTHNIFSMMKERWRNADGSLVATSPELPAIDSLMSVTYNLDIAKIVAGQIVKALWVPEIKMYIYEIEIPVIDLLARPGDDGQIESFVLFRIYRDEITSIQGPLDLETMTFGAPKRT